VLHPEIRLKTYSFKEQGTEMCHYTHFCSMHFQINVSGTRESAFLPVRAHTCCTVLLFVCSYNAFSMTTDALTGFNLSWTNLLTLAKFLGKG
jgi:hypothetical protein